MLKSLVPRSFRTKNKSNKTTYFLRTLKTAREHGSLSPITKPKRKVKTSSQELTYLHGKPSKGHTSTLRLEA
jgi:hypothetical protein